MKRHRFLAHSLVFFVTVFPVHADYYWDGNDVTGNADGGSGTWNSESTNWSTAAAGGESIAWSDAETAVFGGEAGTVTVAPGIVANALVFNTTGYTLEGSAIGLDGGSVTTAGGVEAILESAISGSNGISKLGDGTLILAGANTYTGTTTVAEGTLKLSPAQNFRYYRFTVGVNAGNDGYNQIAELHYFQDGVWIQAPAGSSTGSGSGEQFWANANDNKGASTGMTKFGSTARPYQVTYDFGEPIQLDSYNWSTANDSTPSRNPLRWTVSGSNDGTNFTVIDDRSTINQVGPTTTYTWSGATGAFEPNVDALDGGAADAYALRFSGVPATSLLVVAEGATFDLNGVHQTVVALSDLDGAGGAITNSSAAAPVDFTVGGVGSATFSGTISDDGSEGALQLIKVGSGAQILAGSASNTYSGTTTIGGTGKLVLAKSDGAIAIPGDINLSSTAFNGDNAGLVLAGDEQIADNAIITWTPNGFGLNATGNAVAPQADSFFRLNGHTETVGGLVTSNTSGMAAIENRGYQDATAYGTGHLILKVAEGEFFTYSGQIRNTDLGPNGLGGKIALTKTGPGTQVLAGTMSNTTGPAVVDEGVLRINSLLGSETVTVTGSGILEGTGSLSGLLTIQSGGQFSPGVAGAGAFSVANAVNVADGGTVALSGGSLNGAAVVNAGGVISGTGTVVGALTVQPGGEISPGSNGIGTLNASSVVNLSGTTVLEISKAGDVLTSDQIRGFSLVNYGGTLVIDATGDAPELGDSYQLFEPAAGGSFAGMFTEISGLPELSEGLRWETTSLLSTGRISVIDTSSSPVFGPASGGYVGEQTVTLIADPGATIYYTLDGSEPTTSSLSGTSPITNIVVPVGSVVTVKSFARTPGFGDSPVTTAVFRTVSVPRWNVDADGNWNDGTNWDNEVIPSGSGSIAQFTLPQSESRIVTLDGNRIVGSLEFSNEHLFPWTIASTGGAILTLNVPSGKPEIEVLDVDTTISAPLGGSQGFAKTGPGTLLLTGSSSLGGAIEVLDGVLSVPTLAANGANSPLGSGSTIVLDGGTLRYTGAGSVGFGTFNREVILGENGGTIDTSTPANFWFTAGSFSGPGSLTKVGARQLIIQSNNSYDGITYINEGELQIRTLTALGSTVGKTVVNSPARLALGQNLTATIAEPLELNGFGGGNGAFQSNDGGVNVNWTGPITLATDSGIGGTTGFTISGPISGDGSLVKLVSNAITLSGAESNTYAGSTTLGGTGRLILAKTGGALAIPGDIFLSSTAFNGNNSGVVLAGSEQIADDAVVTWTTTAYGGGAQQDSYFRLNGHTETIAGLVSVGNGAKGVVENRGLGDGTGYGTGTLIINTAGDSAYSYNGGIRDMDGGTGGGAIALVKTGTGTQILSGGLPFTGGIVVNEGTLVVNSATASAITVDGTGILTGSGGTSADLTVEAGGTFAPGNPLGVFTAGSARIAGTFAIELDATVADSFFVNGDLDITGSTLAISTISAPTEASYLIASYVGELTGTFEIEGLPVGYVVTYDSDLGEIRLEQTATGGFGAYAQLNGLSGNPAADLDKDGLADAVEFVLGTSPTDADGQGPTASLVDGNLLFTFTRDHQSLTPDIAVAVQVSDDLVDWTESYAVGSDTASSDEGITVVQNDTSDTVTLTIPMAAGAKRFARLAVTVTP
jgi:autotransporter-associated beta strand protein